MSTSCSGELKKETHTVELFSVFGLISNIQPENSFDSIQIGISNNLSSKKEGVKIKCYKCFNMKYGRHLRRISCSSLMNLLMVIFTLRNGRLNGKILLHVFLFFRQVHRQCAVSA